MPDYPDLNIDDLANLLAHISPDLDRDTWVKVTMGVKCEFGENAFSDWDNWSAGGSTYDRSAALAVWKSCKGRGVSIGTVIHLAKEGGWRPEKKELTDEEKRQRKAENEARRKQRQAEVEADEARLLVMQEQVQLATRRLLAEFTVARGKSEYLDRKQVGAFGVRFIKHAVVLSVDDKLQRCDLWAGDDIKRFFDDLPKPRPDHHSFMMLKPGTFLVPLVDIDGVVWSFQSIAPNGTKLFPKYSRKHGCMHCIGSVADADVVAVAEGYATAASVYLATEWPTVMTVDIYNMDTVVKELWERYPKTKFIIAGDDDPRSKGNPGRTKATELANKLGLVAVFPQVPEQVAA
jgi:putative DNA primase/helicase